MAFVRHFRECVVVTRTGIEPNIAGTANGTPRPPNNTQTDTARSLPPQTIQKRTYGKRRSVSLLYHEIILLSTFFHIRGLFYKKALDFFSPL